jgi:hypothetical protein
MVSDPEGLTPPCRIGREAHRLPVEAAFEEEWAAGVGGALEALLQLGLEAVELVGGEVAVAGGVDEGAGGPRRVVEEGLVPAAGGVVDVDGGGGGLDGGEAVVVDPLFLRPPPPVAALSEDFVRLLSPRRGGKDNGDALLLDVASRQCPV